MLDITSMNDVAAGLSSFEIKDIPRFLHALFWAGLGFPCANIAGALMGKAFTKHASAHQTMLIKKLTYILVLFGFFVIVLNIFGFGIDKTFFQTIIGILAAAIAWASQTGIQNVISGFFLLFERPFYVGDYIVVSDMIGEILTIDLLAINIRTRDNTLVRIPNEILLKSQFQNLSRFPIRRVDLNFKFTFEQDINAIKKLFMKVANNNKLCLDTPPPEFYLMEFTEYGLSVQFSIWVKQKSYGDLKTSLLIDIQKSLSDEKIEIPYYYVTTPYSS